MAVDLEVALPFDNQNVFEDSWESMFDSWLGDAVLAEIGNELTVTAGSGRNVTVADGRCRMAGTYGENQTQKTLPVTVNTSGSSRVDRVVLRIDFSANKIQLDVKAGTPAGSPVPPTLTSNASIRERSLAQVGPLANNYANITTVVDERGFRSGGTLPAYASTSARDLWVPLPRPGQVAFTRNNGQLYVRDTSAWQKTQSRRHSHQWTPSVNENAGTNATWPPGLTDSVAVPAWATVARIQAVIGQAFAFGSGPSNVQVDARIGSVIGPAQRIRWIPSLEEKDIVLLGDADVTSIAGTTQTMRTFVNNLGSGNGIAVDAESRSQIEVEFR